MIESMLGGKGGTPSKALNLNHCAYTAALLKDQNLDLSLSVKAVEIHLLFSCPEQEMKKHVESKISQYLTKELSEKVGI
jgi:hypothetical protein